jgi:hypothetical protein
VYKKAKLRKERVKTHFWNTFQDVIILDDEMKMD